MSESLAAAPWDRAVLRVDGWLLALWRLYRHPSSAADHAGRLTRLQRAMLVWLLGAWAVFHGLTASQTFGRWADVWIAMLAAGPVAGYVLAGVWGWWLEVLCFLAGATLGDGRKARDVYLLGAAAWALPVLAAAALCTAALDSPLDLPKMPLLLVHAVFGLFAQAIWLLGARRAFSLRTFNAVLWLLLFPMLLTALVRVALVAWRGHV